MNFQPTLPGFQSPIVKPEVVYIYAMVDPRTHAVMYVGQSIDPKSRLHSYKQRKGTKVKEWIDALRTEGLKPEMRILAEVGTEDAYRVEHEWIETYAETVLNVFGGEIPFRTEHESGRQWTYEEIAAERERKRTEPRQRVLKEKKPPRVSARLLEARAQLQDRSRVEEEYEQNRVKESISYNW